MKLNECENKNVKVICADNVIIVGLCVHFVTKEEAEFEELRGPCIYIESGEHGLIEIFEDEIIKIEQMN